MICDPVTLEIVRGAVRAAQAEMEALLERTAISAFIREKKDFYTGLFDAAILPISAGCDPAPSARMRPTSSTKASSSPRPAWRQPAW